MSAFDDLGEGVRKIFLAGVGAVALSAEKSQQLVNDLVKKGELTATLPQQQILNRAQDTYSKQPGWALLFCQVYRMLCALYCVVCANIWGGLRERRGGRCF